jgi:hypothetical protein
VLGNDLARRTHHTTHIDPNLRYTRADILIPAPFSFTQRIKRRLTIREASIHLETESFEVVSHAPGVSNRLDSRSEIDLARTYHGNQFRSTTASSGNNQTQPQIPFALENLNPFRTAKTSIIWRCERGVNEERVCSALLLIFGSISCSKWNQTSKGTDKNWV